MAADEPAANSLNSLRRREPAPVFNDVAVGDTFLLMVEGRVTERLYLEGICRCLALGSVHVRVVSPGHRDPVGLIEEAIFERDGPKRRRAEGRASIREPEAYDHVWAVFDIDTSTQNATFGRALEMATRESIRVAISTPSIEFWLLLHFRFTTGPLLNSGAAERALGDAWGQPYDKSKAKFDKLWLALRSSVPEAVKRAAKVRDHHAACLSSFPHNPMTQVDLLVRDLNASVQPLRRILRS